MDCGMQIADFGIKGFKLSLETIYTLD